MSAREARPPAENKDTKTSVLEKELDDVVVKLREKRGESPKTSFKATIAISIIIFVILFGGMSIDISQVGEGGSGMGITIRESTEGSREFSLIIAASGGLIPAIIYAIFRDQRIQEKNDQLAALSLQIKHIRSQILVLKQDEAAKRFDTEGKSAGLTSNF